MILIGAANHFLLIIVLYFLTGVGSGLANVPVMGLMATWFEPNLRGRASGTIVTGNGIGIIMAGHLIPVLNTTPMGWRLSWHILGLMVVVAAGICWLLIRNRPQKKPAQVGGEQVASVSQQRPSLREDERQGDRVFVLCGAIYFLFGFTYVIFMTFFVTSLVQERQLSEVEAGVLWSWVGLLSLGSGPIFGYLSDRFGRKHSLVAVFTIQALAYISAIAYLPEMFLYISIICFGIVAWSIPTIMVALIGDLAGPERTTTIFGFVTFIFGIGQISGPYCAGLMAEFSGGFATSFVMAAVLALGAAVLSTLLPGTTRRRRYEKDIPS
jgi:MFS family permease